MDLAAAGAGIGDMAVNVTGHYAPNDRLVRLSERRDLEVLEDVVLGPLRTLALNVVVVLCDTSINVDPRVLVLVRRLTAEIDRAIVSNYGSVLLERNDSVEGLCEDREVMDDTNRVDRYEAVTGRA